MFFVQNSIPLLLAFYLFMRSTSLCFIWGTCTRPSICRPQTVFAFLLIGNCLRSNRCRPTTWLVAQSTQQRVTTLWTLFDKSLTMFLQRRLIPQTVVCTHTNVSHARISQTMHCPSCTHGAVCSDITCAWPYTYLACVAYDWILRVTYTHTPLHFSLGHESAVIGFRVIQGGRIKAAG